MEAWEFFRWKQLSETGSITRGPERMVARGALRSRGGEAKSQEKSSKTGDTARHSYIQRSYATPGPACVVIHKTVNISDSHKKRVTIRQSREDSHVKNSHVKSSKTGDKDLHSYIQRSLATPGPACGVASHE